MKVKLNVELKVECSECGADLYCVEEKSSIIKIIPCKNCCKEILPFTGKCYDCVYVGDLQCLLQHGDNLDGKCIYFKQKN